MKHRIFVSLALLSCLHTLGCLPNPRITVEDDLDFELFHYALHTPYVVGASVGITVGRRGDAKVDGWSAESGSPSVFSIDQTEPAYDGETFTVRCTAVSAGDTELVIRNAQGGVATQRSIAVRMPDRIELIPAGLIKVRGDDAPPVGQGEPVRILAGGTATFEVAYYRGQERLFGNGALVLSTADASLLAETDQTYFFENREWLRLTADGVGTGELVLMVGGEEVTRVTVERLPPEAIDSVEIEAESTSGAEDEDLLYLLAHAYDEAMNDLWGVAFRWSVDGASEQGAGDLFYYYYEQGSDAVVESEIEGITDEVVVSMSDGGVTSSNSLGCSSAGTSEGLLALLVLILFLALRRLRIR